MSETPEEISLDFLPNLGVKTPENSEEMEKRRQSVVKLVNEFEKPNNYDSFREATIRMFGEFGISPAADPKFSEKNEKLWKRQYSSYHEIGNINPTANSYSDLEMYGKGAYANIYIRSEIVKTSSGPKKVFKVCPGACSLPGPVPKGESDTSYHYPERNFYKTFEEVVGVDVSYRDSQYWYQSPEVLQEASHMFSFYVVDGKYYRVNALDSRSKIQNIVSTIKSFVTNNPASNLKY